MNRKINRYKSPKKAQDFKFLSQYYRRYRKKEKEDYEINYRIVIQICMVKGLMSFIWKLKTVRIYLQSYFAYAAQLIIYFITSIALKPDTSVYPS